ncbi:MAG: hypothetical protein QOD69_2075 [Solirubrobacteraceae bacterium]|jgi:hypothetical protein|nr:hypothetical protein [Solirubrobacteraceae bacterium]
MIAPPEVDMPSTESPHHALHPRRVSFPDLVRVHFRWRRSVNADSAATEDERDELQREYQETLRHFEHEHGEIVSAYWCSDVESAVALTAGRPRTGWLRRLLAVSPKFHRVSDWATKDEPEIARALHECDELAIRTCEVLRGRSRRICIQLVMTSACHLLALIDAKSEHRSPADHRKAIAAEQHELAVLRHDYRQAANGDAQLVYFAGMVIGIALLVLLYVVAGGILHARENIEDATIVGCLVAGAVGAVVSVIARVNSGSFALDVDVARGYTLFVGGLRPLIGSIFGLVAYFALTSGFIEMFKLPPEHDTKRFYFLCVIAFAAGFSERWAQDTLTGGLSGRGRGPADHAASAKGRPAATPPRPAAPVGDRDLAAD